MQSLKAARRSKGRDRAIGGPSQKDPTDLSKGGAELERLWFGAPSPIGRSSGNTGMVSRGVAAVIRPMIGHAVSDDRAANSANSADDQAYGPANDRPADRASDGASDRAILIRHGGRGKHQRRQNGGRR